MSGTFHDYIGLTYLFNPRNPNSEIVSYNTIDIDGTQVNTNTHLTLDDINSIITFEANNALGSNDSVSIRARPEPTSMSGLMLVFNSSMDPSMILHSDTTLKVEIPDISANSIIPTGVVVYNATNFIGGISVLPPSLGGTGITGTPTNGQILVGTSTGIFNLVTPNPPQPQPTDPQLYNGITLFSSGDTSTFSVSINPNSIPVTQGLSIDNTEALGVPNSSDKNVDTWTISSDITGFQIYQLVTSSDARYMVRLEVTGMPDIGATSADYVFLDWRFGVQNTTGVATFINLDTITPALPIKVVNTTSGTLAGASIIASVSSFNILNFIMSISARYNTRITVVRTKI